MDDASTREIYEAERPKDARIDKLEIFAREAWRLSVLAQAEIDNGDPQCACLTMVQIAEAAAKALGEQ